MRAALESIAYQTRDLVEAMERDAGRAIQSVRVDGGASVNAFLMQFQADILGMPLVRPRSPETTALGAAFAAGLAAGVWKNRAELAEIWQADTIFEPAMDEAAARRPHRRMECGRCRRAIVRQAGREIQHL